MVRRVILVVITLTFFVAKTASAAFSPPLNSRMMTARLLKNKAVVDAAAAAAISRKTIAYSTTTRLAAIQYLLKYDYIPDVLEKRGPFREGHLQLAKQLIAEGNCLSGGPTTRTTVGDNKVQSATPPTGALFIFTDKDAAQQFVDQDPYVLNGIVTGHVIEEWNIVVQKE